MTTNLTKTGHPAAEGILRTGHQRPVEHVEATGGHSLGDPDGPLADRVAYSVAEAALMTGLSRDLLYDQMRIGKLPYLKVGRRRVISRRNLEAFLENVAS